MNEDIASVDTEDGFSEMVPHRPEVGLARVAVRGLFDEYSYDIPDAARGTTLTDRRLVLLYADNGAGKTTVLNLIFHLLSAAGNRGHRSAIARIQFQLFTVTLSNGFEIAAEREESVTGSYRLKVKDRGTLILDVKFIYDESRDLVDATEDGDGERSYYDFLSGLGLQPLYLADDRQLHADWLPRPGDEEETAVVRSGLGDGGRFIARRRTEPSDRVQIVRRSMNQLQAALRRRALDGTATGSQGANAIYQDVVDRLAHAPDPFGQARSDVNGSEILKDLEALEERSLGYAKFGLAPAIHAREFSDSILGADEGRLPLIEDVLRPHLEGLKARYDALADLQGQIDRFITSANTFLTNKQLHYHLGRGITIETSKGERLQPEDLSSGERQLVLLLCNAMIARERTKLFIVDEPEISLNAKWQRGLLPALLSCTEGTGMQFLVATHSIEILAGHRPDIEKLAESS